MTWLWILGIGFYLLAGLAVFSALQFIVLVRRQPRLLASRGASQFGLRGFMVSGAECSPDES